MRSATGDERFLRAGPSDLWAKGPAKAIGRIGLGDVGEALGGISGAATPPGVVEPATGARPGSLWMPWAQWVLAVVPYGDAFATNQEPSLTDH